MSRKTHCPQGHEYTTANSRVRQRRLRSGKMLLWNTCKTCANINTKRYRHIPTESAVRTLFAGLSEGFTISNITDHRLRPPECVKVRVERWQGIKAQMPKVAARIIRLSNANAKARLQERCRLYRVEAPAIVHRRILDIWQTVQSLVPPFWPDDKRQETIARVGLELSDGRCSPTEAAIRAAIKRASTDHNRMFSEWALGGGAGKWVSLDAPRWEDGATTVGDTVSEGLWA